MIRSLLLVLAFLQQSAAPSPDPGFRYQRQITLTPAAGQTCVTLDAAVFAHTEPFLKDLRLYALGPSGAAEIPYVLTLSEAQGSENEPARVLNLRPSGRAIDFDLAMPDRPYTEINLDVTGQNFLATATVTGLDTPGSRHATPLGAFQLFDLTAQHLSRSTSIHLQESTFPLLHVHLTASSARGATLALTPQLLRGVTVPPSRESQTLFTVAAQTSTLEQRGGDTVAHLNLPPRVPIERVAFTFDPAFHANFSREVRVSAHIVGTPVTSGELVRGTIQRVKINAGSRSINQQQLSLSATLGANLQSPAAVEVTVPNAGEPPLPIASVQLKMRQRDLCFQAVSGQRLLLAYGLSELPAPAYDFSGTYTPGARTEIAQLGPEQLNPRWRPRLDARPYTQRHPHLLWIALLIGVCSSALLAFRSSRHHGHHPHR